MNTNTLTSVAVLAGLPGMKSLYQPVKVDSKAIQEFMAFYHILKQQSPLKCISWRIVKSANTSIFDSC